jgi:hypothetical protein
MTRRWDDDPSSSKAPPDRVSCRPTRELQGLAKYVFWRLERLLQSCEKL